MTRTALILAAHGSGDGSRANRLVLELAEQLGDSDHFHEVMAAFNLGKPGFAEVLNDIRSDRVVFVPVMTSDGYFRDTVLPRELTKNHRSSEVEIHVTPSVGTHDGVVEILARRAEDAMNRFDLNPAHTAVIVVGHGTERHRRSRLATTIWRDVLRRKSIFDRVEAAFLDEAPRIEELPGMLTQRNLVAIPFLIGGGHHVLRDIPERLGLRPTTDAVLPLVGRVDDRFVVCTDGIGTDPGLIEIIRDLAKGRNAGGTTLPTSLAGRGQE